MQKAHWLDNCKPKPNSPKNACKITTHQEGMGLHVLERQNHRCPTEMKHAQYLSAPSIVQPAQQLVSEDEHFDKSMVHGCLGWTEKLTEY